jgi:predicted solute-binding protein
LAGQAIADEEQAQIPKPTLQAGLNLAARTYPQVKFKRSDSPPGPILYPEYMDFSGVAEVYGPPEFLKAMDAKLRDVERDPAAAKDFLFVRLVRYEDGKPVEIRGVAEKMKIRMGSDDRRGPEGFEWLFSIPSDAMKLEPGAYRFELGMWYEENGTHKTVGAVAYFEVRDVKKGSDDEINLLSNAISNEVPGLSDRLLADPTYAKKDLAQKILELDPDDVFARYALALKALQLDGDPDTAVRMWAEIQKLVADGKAHRPESLIISSHSGMREPLTKEEYERMLSQSISLRSQQAKVAQEQSAKAKEEIAALVHDGKFQEIIALTATTGPKGILSSDNMWQVLWAIRAVKNAKTKEAHETLVQELAKLPHIPAMFQREIVDALAAIHDDEVHGNFSSHRWDEDIAIIEWWIARPKPEDFKPASSDEAREKVAALVRDGKYQEVIALIATGEKGLWAADNIWPTLWAIRAVKEAKAKEAHEALVKELAKLPHTPGLFQKEIVDALAAIHDDKAHADLSSHTLGASAAIIEWWLAHPKLENIQSKNGEKDAMPPKDGEPAPPAKGRTTPPTEGTPPPPGNGNP